ncbi:hypothetical protein P3342_001910 [Pyrenophora teres f. teres]|nr:hypothetical protein P3342_001910 [Pyrenophora teres f. teres]
MTSPSHLPSTQTKPSARSCLSNRRSGRTFLRSVLAQTQEPPSSLTLSLSPHIINSASNRPYRRPTHFPCCWSVLYPFDLFKGQTRENNHRGHVPSRETWVEAHTEHLLQNCLIY